MRAPTPSAALPESTPSRLPPPDGQGVHAPWPHALRDVGADPAGGQGGEQYQREKEDRDELPVDGRLSSIQLILGDITAGTNPPEKAQKKAVREHNTLNRYGVG
jgi:hypothetical protein